MAVTPLVVPATAAGDPVPFPELPRAGRASFSGFRVRALLLHGDTLYVGGSFSVSQSGVTRTNLAAFDLNGNLKPAFSANPNGMVWALATDGVSLFVGGEFTRLGLKKHLAAVDLVTGVVKRPFSAHFAGVLDVPEEGEDPADPAVRALAVVTDTRTAPAVTRLLVAGNFTQVNGIADNRAGLAALVPETGDLDAERFTRGVEGGPVDTLLATANRVYVGGAFTSAQGRNASLVALDLGGSLRAPFATNGQPVLDLDIDPVSARLFAGIGGGGNCVAAFPANSQNRANPIWQTPHVGGDVQAVHFFRGNVYFGFHDGLWVEPDAHKLAVVDADTGAFELDADHPGTVCDSTPETEPNCWLPQLDNTAGGQGFFGVWRIRDFVDPVSGAARLLVGGDFTQIAGVSGTRRLAIFEELPPPPPPPPPDPPPLPPPDPPPDPPPQ